MAEEQKAEAQDAGSGYYRAPKVRVLADRGGELVLGKPLWHRVIPGALLTAVGATVVVARPEETVAFGWFVAYVAGVLASVAGLCMMLLRRRMRIGGSPPSVVDLWYLGFIPVRRREYGGDEVRTVRLKSERRANPLWASQLRGKSSHWEFCSYLVTGDGSVLELSHSSDVEHERELAGHVAERLGVVLQEQVEERAIRMAGSDGWRMIVMLVLLLIVSAAVIAGMVMSQRP